MPHKSYHNTTGQTGETLALFTAKGAKQEELILANFDKPFSPSQMLTHLRNERLIGFDVPITSIRRAMSNLTRDGKLIKTNVKVIGIYGREEFLWEKK